MRTTMGNAGLDLGVSTSRGNSLITDICAAFLHPTDDTWMATSGWMACLDALGITESAARTSLHRMSRGGYLERRAREAVPGYLMSEAWRRLMSEPPAQPVARWLLVTFTVPEELRNVRHQLRTVLLRTGFGSLGNGVWIGSASRNHLLQRVLVEGGLDEYVDLFEADHVGFGSDDDLAHRCWDLEGLAAAGHTLLDRLQQMTVGGGGNGAAAFAEFVEMANECRHYLESCPDLPAGAQPVDWPAAQVERALSELKRARQVDAHAWFATVRCGRLRTA